MTAQLFQAYQDAKKAKAAEEKRLQQEEARRARAAAQERLRKEREAAKHERVELLKADQADLLRHEKEIAAHQSFNYALFDTAETALLGCVYIDPPERAGADGEISWWVVDELVGSKVEQALDALVPHWIADDWPFEQPRFLGREISWSDWLTLPEYPDT
ncbi:hypothetical protein ABZZ36_38785 [Actinacidiphila glaucinigra]|uniref:hypothetical protein n=1 Tax=Actinacidiphila glaucinigra TaxID=235986 RepID=UPI0033B35A1E